MALAFLLGTHRTAWDGKPGEGRDGEYGGFSFVLGKLKLPELCGWSHQEGR